MTNNINQQYQGLDLALIKTLIFFDLFAYPLTIYEAWSYLPIETSFLEVKRVLKKLLKSKTIKVQQGFYYLATSEQNLDYRQERYHFANRKFKIARRVARLFSFLPWLKFIAVSNLIGRQNMRDGSDIDLFIITSPNRLWLTRLFCAGLMKIFNQRPTPENKRDKICLSFYVDSDHLNLSELALSGDDDWYFYYWLAGLYSLYDEGGYYFRLIKSNQWLKKYLPNIDFLLSNQAYTPAINFRPRSRLDSKIIRRLLDLVMNSAEKLAEKWQRKIMPLALKEAANLNSGVIIKPGILKLYPVDRRQEFKQRYTRRLSVILKQ